jgi:hypothetical protein
MELGCTAQGYRVPVAAVLHMRMVRPAEVASSRLVVVDRTVAADRTAVVAHTAAVVQEIGSHRQADKATACSAVCRAEGVQDKASSVVELAPQMRRRQPDVLREACRSERKSRR